MQSVTIVVPGKPVAKARHRNAVRKKCAKCGSWTMSSQCRCGNNTFNESFSIAYPDKDTVRYENLVALFARQQMTEQGLALFEGGLKVQIAAYFDMPDSRKCNRHKDGCTRLHDGDTHTQKPDFDNIAKSVCDGMLGIVWRDDSQVAKAVIDKYWGNEPRVEIVITEL